MTLCSDMPPALSSVLMVENAGVIVLQNHVLHVVRGRHLPANASVELRDLHVPRQRLLLPSRPHLRPGAATAK